MKKTYLNIVFFLVPLFLLGTLNIINPQKPTVSQLENRALKTKPVFSVQTLANGEYFKEYESFFADTFIFRESLVKIGGNIKDLRGFPGKDTPTIVINTGANVSQAQPHPKQQENPENNIDTTSDNSNTNSSKNIDGTDTNTANPDTVNVTNGRVLVFNDAAMEIHTFNAEASQYYANFINDFQGKLNNNNIKVYSLLTPTQIEFIKDKKYKSLSSSQYNTIEYINKHFNKSIIPVNAYEKLAQNSDQYLYFRSDHHWTALGAYYAYTAFMQTKNETPISIDRYEKDKVSPYLGSLYSTTLSKKIRENPDTIYLYKPFINHEYNIYYTGAIKMDVLDMSQAETKNKYGIFISGDRPWGKITTEIKNGRKIVIIKDSYANAFVPFLIPHYEEIYVVDPRQFTLNIYDFIKNNEINEVLFLNYILVTDYKDFTDLLIEMSNR